VNGWFLLFLLTAPIACVMAGIQLSYAMHHKVCERRQDNAYYAGFEDGEEAAADRLMAGPGTWPGYHPAHARDNGQPEQTPQLAISPYSPQVPRDLLMSAPREQTVREWAARLEADAWGQADTLIGTGVT